MAKKPNKPRPDFPLFPHAAGQWAKKIRGKTHYFGVWSDPDSALQNYLRDKDELQAGRTPRVQRDEPTVRDLLNQFLTTKIRLVQNGELAQRTFNDYKKVCTRVADYFGLDRFLSDIRAEDFSEFRHHLTRGIGLVTLANIIQRVRVIFKFAYDAELVESPIRLGPGFKKPSQKAIRESRNAKPLRMFEASEIRLLIDSAREQLKAMILLGINCGFSQSEISLLTAEPLDLLGGWINYPRTKTAVPRFCPLWDETVAALQAVIEKQGQRKTSNHPELIFLTKNGNPWVRVRESGTHDDATGKQFKRLMSAVGIEKPGLNFGALRHTFETIGGECKDQVAVDSLMGHSRGDMASVYRERISEDRLRAVTNTIHEWLFTV